MSSLPGSPEPKVKEAGLPRSPLPLIAILVSGTVLMTLTLLGLAAFSNYTHTVYMSRMLALSEARFQTAEAHILLEEITAGDTGETISQMDYHLGSADDALAALRDGGRLGPLRISALTGRPAAAMASAAAHLNEVRAIATTRLEKAHAAAGSKLDRQLDRAYFGFLAEVDRAQNQLQEGADASTRSFRLISLLLLLGISGAGGAAVVMGRRRKNTLDVQGAGISNGRDPLAEMTLLAATVDQASEVIFITDREARILYVNRAFTRLLGYSQDEVYNEYAEVLRSPQHDTEFYEDLFYELSAGAPWRGTLFYRCKDGSDLETEAAITPIRGKNGMVSHQVSVARDVTREKTLQMQMEHMQRLESLGVLAGGIAHDFNNILTSIMGSAGLARLQAGDDPKMDDYLERIETSAERAADLCQQMLAYSGRGAIQTGPVDLSAAVTELGRLMEATVPKTIRVKMHLPDNLPPVSGDRGQLSQVIMNLLINAQEAIGDAPGTIRVTTGEAHAGPEELAGAAVGVDSPPGDYVMLEVADTGCGMDPETRQRIFDPFFTTKFTGRGLGMSALMGIVRAHRGVVLVASQPGHGTTFRVLLPPSELEPIPPREERSEAPWKVAGTVLIVDDEEPVRRVAEAMLARIGFDTLGARDGVEGLSTLEARQDEIVCVLLDLTMPRMPGAQVLEKIRELSSTLPVVLISGYTATEAQVHDDRVRFLQKPFSASELESVLRALLDTRATGQELNS